MGTKTNIGKNLEVGSIIGSRPFNKNNNGPELRPSLVQSHSKEYLQLSKEINSGLDLVDLTTRDQMEQTSLERVAQPSLVATGNCSLTLVAGAITNASIIKNSPKDAGESSTIFLPAVISKGDEPKAMAVA